MASRREQAAAAHFLLDVPTVLAIPGSDAVQVIDLGVEELTDDRVREQRPDGFKQRVPAQHKADQRLDARRAHGGLKRSQAGEVERHGLLEQEMFSRLRGCDPLRHVKMVRRADGNDPDSGVVQQIFQVIVGAAGRELVLLSLRGGARLVPAQDGAHLRVRIGLKSPDVLSRNPTRP